MDSQLEQKIRERAYELWMQHGSLPNRADDYWYQAEEEILRRQEDRGQGIDGPAIVGDEEAAVETSPAPLGMTSQTLDEVLSAPAAPKARKRRSTAAATADTASDINGVAGETVVAPKRKRPRKTTP
ncbi:DUF2934 domain-containing protein [Microvirga sp. TS319]|uniref:DUF2934 domain-containing protein n=1 Tax=Microvirga sp. TS319 TaxID=3241165 RepID=UPI00351A0255